MGEGFNDAQREQRAVQLGLSPGEILLLNQGYDKLVQNSRRRKPSSTITKTAKTAALGLEVRQIYETHHIG